VFERSGDRSSVERFFDHLSARDWDALGQVLAPQVVRIGPFGDRVESRERYLDLLAGVVPEAYGNDVHRVTYARDGASAFARVTEHLRYPGAPQLDLEEAYSFELDVEGRIVRVEIFAQNPDDDPHGFGSAASDKSYGARPVPSVPVVPGEGGDEPLRPADQQA